MKLCSLALVCASVLLASTVESLNSAPATSEYITLDALKRIEAETSASANASYADKSSRRQQILSTTDETPFLLPVLFNFSEKAVVSSLPINGTYKESFVVLQTSDENVIPFASKVAGNDISAIAEEISNSTLEDTAGSYRTGSVSVTVGPLRTSDQNELRLSSLSTKCTVALVLDSTSDEILSGFYYTYIRSPPYDAIITSPWTVGADAAISCNGATGRVFNDHGDGSQRLWRLSGTDTADTSVGEIQKSDLSEGNEVLFLSDSAQASIARVLDSRIGSSAGQVQAGLSRDLASQYEEETRQYNTPSFLILSATAVLSSAAIAVLSRSSSRKEKCLVLSETAVVFAFLIVVVHVLRSLSRGLAFRLNAEVTHTAKYGITEEDSELIVQVITKQRLALVAEKLAPPKLLVATVAITVLAAICTILGAILAMRKSRKRKADEEAM